MKKYMCATCKKWIRKMPCGHCGENKSIPCSTVKNTQSLSFCKRCKQRFKCYTERKEEVYFSIMFIIR